MVFKKEKKKKKKKNRYSLFYSYRSHHTSLYYECNEKYFVKGFVNITILK